LEDKKMINFISEEEKNNWIKCFLTLIPCLGVNRTDAISIADNFIEAFRERTPKCCEQPIELCKLGVMNINGNIYSIDNLEKELVKAKERFDNLTKAYNDLVKEIISSDDKNLKVYNFNIMNKHGIVYSINDFKNWLEKERKERDKVDWPSSYFSDTGENKIYYIDDFLNWLAKICL
jgi:hypothetical protein